MCKHERAQSVDAKRDSDEGDQIQPTTPVAHDINNSSA